MTLIKHQLGLQVHLLQVLPRRYPLSSLVPLLHWQKQFPKYVAHAHLVATYVTWPILHQVHNQQCDDGVHLQYKVLPFTDGTFPTDQEVFFLDLFIVVF